MGRKEEEQFWTRIARRGKIVVDDINGTLLNIKGILEEHKCSKSASERGAQRRTVLNSKTTVKRIAIAAGICNKFYVDFMY